MSASTQIAVERLGSGPVILLLHGEQAPGYTWDRQRELADHWSLVIPTRRPAAPGAGPDADVTDVRGLITRRTHLVGVSSGALIVTLAAEGEPDMIRSLTLVEPPEELVRPDAQRVLDDLARPGIPVMLVTGGHDDAAEARADSLAKRLDARREVLEGDGEPVPRAPLFNETLETFLRGALGTARFRTS
jgi:pimeloyl-ACP methyl ester carboxylesterase